MKIYLLIAILSSFLTVCHAENKIILDLSNGITWKGIFDVGFRPKHLREGESMCSQQDVDLSIKTSSDEILDIGRGDVKFQLKEGNLVRLLFFTAVKRLV